MKHFLTRIILSLAVVASVLAPAAPAFAGTNLFNQTCATPGAGTSTVCRTAGGDAITTTNGVIHRVSVILAILAGAVAVIVMVVGGIRYIASGGDSEQVARAKRTIIYAIIGLAAVVLGQTIISFVLSGLN